MKAQYQVSNGLAPVGEPLCVPVTLDLTTTAELTIDFQLEESNGVIGTIQTLYIDNADNAQPLEIIFAITGQRIKCGANRQGYFPVLVTDTQFRAKSTGAVKVNVHFVNVPMPAAVWSV